MNNESSSDGDAGKLVQEKSFFFNIFSIHNFAKISVLMSYETPFCTSSFHSYELEKHVVLTRMVMWLHLKENIVIEEWVGFFFKYGNWKWKRLLLLFVFLTHLCIKQSSWECFSGFLRETVNHKQTHLFKQLLGPQNHFIFNGFIIVKNKKKERTKHILF